MRRKSDCSVGDVNLMEENKSDCVFVNFNCIIHCTKHLKPNTLETYLHFQNNKKKEKISPTSLANPNTHHSPINHINKHLLEPHKPPSIRTDPHPKLLHLFQIPRNLSIHMTVESNQLRHDLVVCFTVGVFLSTCEAVDVLRMME